MTPARLAIVGVVGALAASTLLHAQAEARARQAAEGEGDGGTALDYFDAWGAIERAYEQRQTEGAMHSTNMRAFLDMIAFAEGTDRAADQYRVCYGYRHTIRDLSDHPAVTGEWKGESIANLGPQYTGKVSTAAGRYQLIRPTWLGCKRALNLPDFSPASQDAAAVYLIRQRRAADDVEAGRIAEAIDKCAAEWASLPGSTSGQPQRKLLALLDRFSAAGGALA